MNKASPGTGPVTSSPSDRSALIDGATCERVDAAQGDGFSIWRRLGDRLVACESVNDAKTHMRARRELAAQMAA